MSVVRKSPVPPDAAAVHALEHVDYADTYTVHVDTGSTGFPEHFARLMFANPPQWIAFLSCLRDWIVSLVGLKKASDMIANLPQPGHRQTGRNHLQIFKRDDDELLFGLDDRHLDFRISIRRIGASELCVTSAVKFNNWMGRLYFLPVKPMHRIIVPAMMRRAADSLAAAHT